MNDFFFHLAARSFDHAGEIELVRPRLPSFFEFAPEKPHDFAEIFTGSERNEVFENSKESSLRSTDSRAPVQVNLDFESRKDPYGRSVRLPEDGVRTPFYPVGAITSIEDQAAPIESDPLVQTQAQFESLGDDPVQSSQKASELSISPSPLRFEPPGRLAEQLRPSPISVSPNEEPGQYEDSGAVRQLLTERPEDPPKQGAVTPVLVEKVRLIEPIQGKVDLELTPLSSAPDTGSGQDEKPSGVRQQLTQGTEKLPKQAAVTQVLVDKVRRIEPNQRIFDLQLPPGKKEDENRQLGIGRSVFQPIGAVFHPRKETAMRGAASQPEPTINVTIGRIEVRAVTASKVEKRKAAPSSMSLDEYLARRTGGRS